VPAEHVDVDPDALLASLSERPAHIRLPRDFAVVGRRPRNARFKGIGSPRSICGEQAQPIANAFRVIRHAAHVIDQLVPEDRRNPEFILDAE
jgi:hypothetical protein